MENSVILDKAIEKAEDLGYKHDIYTLDHLYDCNLYQLNNTYYLLYSESYGKIDIRSIIFSHDFAKAFWPECKNPDHGPLCIIHNQDIRHCVTWQYHLQQIVLEKEPLKYLERFL